jgi:hypothetical protein
MLKGEITYRLTDVETGEVQENKVTNILTEAFYDAISRGLSLNIPLDNVSVVITSYSMESSRWTSIAPINEAGFSLVRDTNVPAISNPQIFEPVGNDPLIFQWNGRWNPPTSSSRTIRSVFLSSSNSGISASSYFSWSSVQTFSNNVLAFAKLNTPCVQSTSQVLDVYYRLLWTSVPGESIPPEIQSNLMKFLAGEQPQASMSGFPIVHSPFASLDLNPSDVGVINPTGLENRIEVYRTFSGSGAQINLETAYPTSSSFEYGKFKVNSVIPFSSGEGRILNSFYGPAAVSPSSTFINSGAFSSKASFGSKIQNLIGKGSLSTQRTGLMFLDVDNLPSGTGSAFLGGNWNNRSTPSVAGGYFRTEVPELNRIIIQSTGGVGSGSYNWVKRKFLGIVGSQESTGSPNAVYPLNIPALSNTQPGPDTNSRLFGDISDASLNSASLTSSIAYDDTSFVLAKRNFVLLYSPFSGRYWRYPGAYTDIGQLAVFQGKIYVGCRATGLYVIDPVQNLGATPVPNSAGGDFSRCYGVHVGNAGTLWAVVNNGLMSFNGTTWTRYHPGSVPAFSIAGITDSNYSNVSYLKVDEYSATNEMLLVRRLDASSLATDAGVWWSTSTPASNAGVIPIGLSQSSLGWFRSNRTHIAAASGYWVLVSSDRFYAANFGQTFNIVHTPQSTSHTSAASSLRIEVDSAGVPSIFSQESAFFGSQTGLRTLRFLTNGTVVSNTGGVLWDNDIISRYPSRLNSSNQPDLSCSFRLTKDVSVYLIAGEASNSELNLEVAMSTYLGDGTPEGGVFRPFLETVYGWNGSSWVQNSSTPRQIHSTDELLERGVTVRFQNGSSGTSFSAGNLYQFGLTEGILKDNATRARIQFAMNFRQTRRLSTMSQNTVPGNIAGAVAPVTIDFSRSSSSSLAVVNSNPNAILFTGQNSFQSVVGTQQAVGDFVLQYDIAALSNPNCRSVMFGVGKSGFHGCPLFGFEVRDNEIFAVTFLQNFYRTFFGFSFVQLGTLSGTTSLSIQRTGSLLRVERNGVFTVYSGVWIRNFDLVLDTLFSTSIERTGLDASLSQRAVPRGTFTSNGSARFLAFGNSGTSTGFFHPRFCGIDTGEEAGLALSMNSIPALLKDDGTAPAAGEVTIDGHMGLAYFNSANQGQPITASYLQIST